MKALALLVLILAAAVAISCTQVRPASPARASAPPFQPQPDEFAANQTPLSLPLVQPRVVIGKSKRRLKLYSADKLVRTYRVALGLSPVEDKIRQGDRKTPEGTFYVFTKNDKSAYFLSLGLSYPNSEDAERGLRDGLIRRKQYDRILTALRKKTAPPQNTALGGDIYIHGNGSQSDWTWGCVALDDKDMRELFDAVPVGTEVVIEH
jgi:murein L,D-transpeptidase YafK